MALSKNDIFLCDLAILLCRPLHEVQQWSYEEVMIWDEYLKMFPPGWRADQTAAAAVQYANQGEGTPKPPQHFFPALKAVIDATTKPMTKEELHARVMAHSPKKKKPG